MAEAVGFVLAVVPMIISACEHYGEAARGIQRYRHANKGAEDLIMMLEIQEAIFRSANIRLLASCVGRDEAHLMLGDFNHPGWKESGLIADYRARLGESQHAFTHSIKLINEHLANLRLTIDGFDKHSDVNEQDAHAHHRKLSFKKRIRLAFSQSGIEQSLESLMKKTQNFSTLIAQTEPSQSRTSETKITLSTRREIAKFARIKDAASNLYQTLGYACTKHTSHQAQLSLEPSCKVQESTRTDPLQVRFTMAFSHLTLQPQATASDLSKPSAWLTIESSVSGMIQSEADNVTLQHMQVSAKRTRDSEDDESLNASTAQATSLQKKAVRFQCAQAVAVPVVPAEEPILPNLCTNENFCLQLRNFINQASPSTKAVGYLGHQGSQRHLIYVDAKSQRVTQGKGTSLLRSLRQLLQSTNNAGPSIPILLHYERLRLAHLLSIAVLQFRSTPWLANSWNSNEILVSTHESSSTTTDDTTITNFHEPYVSACIRNPYDAPARSNTLRSRTLIRNQLLFRLGVMLLEIAFQKPLDEMKETSDTDGGDDSNADFWAADRLQHQVSACLAPRYAEVVRKCIHCDFGKDFDLTATKLQEAFYQDVVCELKRLEDLFRAASMVG
ncbi:hypothetical protein EPUS_05341 [Endocarpon pusillum Z07020]|uniref:DUF7580 domain-containing protein n=1 Tax=Endocarpon pusillum (strain Z07020 / HMAS-L-300199) TaxID=1263415 RepID=U1GNP2_ENDPU|nr:uncharacterized protein EPUS_05341 [Endocarpon pusillum Z07020]ERF73918.1 hypothetical protein EPUS_05341 [Endocarpon pusillum Z07020]